MIECNERYQRLMNRIGLCLILCPDTNTCTCCRFKVRSDIARKQLMVVSSPSSTLMSNTNASNGTSVGAPFEDTSSVETEVNKWKSAYEKAVKDNEQLKTRGGDVLILAQWKERYETCLAEKEELSEKLKIYGRMSSVPTVSFAAASGHHGHSSGTGTGSHFGQGSGVSDGSKSIEQLYIDLRDEYRVRLTHVLIGVPLLIDCLIYFSFFQI